MLICACEETRAARSILAVAATRKNWAGTTERLLLLRDVASTAELEVLLVLLSRKGCRHYDFAIVKGLGRTR